MAMYVFRDWLHDLESVRPSRLLDQHFGMGLSAEELEHSPMVHSHQAVMPRHYFRQWRVPSHSQDIGSTVHCDKDRFHVNLDVQQFSPEEVQVKVVDNSVVVEGKHEEKQDEHGYISRHFVRRYVVPKEYKLDAIASSLSSDGVLTISTPRVEAVKEPEKIIPIKQTGGPHKAVKEAENKPKEPENKQN